MRISFYGFSGFYLTLLQSFSETDSFHNSLGHPQNFATLAAYNMALNIETDSIYTNCSISSKNIPSCTCMEYIGFGRYTICCTAPQTMCCHCYANCSLACGQNWKLMNFIQLGMSTILLFGVIATIILFFRICTSKNFLSRRTPEPRTDLLSTEYDDTISISSSQRYISERLRDRPPRYNEIYQVPPPNTDSNGVTIPEAPPAYPGLLEREDRTPAPNMIDTSTNVESTIPHRPPAVHHM